MAEQFSLKDKIFLQRIISYGPYNKQVLITLKAIRNREPELAQLSSYQLKTIFFWWMLDASPSCTQGTLSQNVIAFLRLLENKLSQRNLPHYFLPEKNLLTGMTDSSIQSLKFTINCLLMNEHKMMRALTLWQQGRPFLDVLQNFLWSNKRRLDQRVYDSIDKCLMFMLTIERLLQENFSCRFHNTGDKTTLVYEMLMIISCNADELKPYDLSRVLVKFIWNHEKETCRVNG